MPLLVSLISSVYKNTRFTLSTLCLLLIAMSGCGGGGGGGGAGTDGISVSVPPASASLVITEGDDHGGNAESISAEGAVVLEFDVAVTGENTTLYNLDLSSFGSGNEVSDITSVRLYRDENGNNIFDSFDILEADGLANGPLVFSGDNADLRFIFTTPHMIQAGKVERFYIVYGFDERLASPGETFGLTLRNLFAGNDDGATVNPTLNSISTSNGGITTIGNLDLSAGIVNPADRNLELPLTSVLMWHGTLESELDKPTDISGFIFNTELTNTFQFTDIEPNSVELYLDADNNGIADNGSVPLNIGGSTISSSSVTVDGFSHIIPSFTTHSFLLYVDLNSGASGGDSVTISLRDQNILVNTDDREVFGGTITGGSVTVTRAIIADIQSPNGTTFPESSSNQPLLGSGSHDPDPGDIVVSYEWSFLDLIGHGVAFADDGEGELGATSSLVDVMVIIPNRRGDSEITVQLVVTSSDGTTDTTTTTLSILGINEPPIAEITVVEGTDQFFENQSILLTAVNTVDPDTNDIHEYKWEITGTDPVTTGLTFLDETGVTSSTLPSPVLRTIERGGLGGDYSVDIKLTVTDLSGASTFDTITFDITQQSLIGIDELLDSLVFINPDTAESFRIIGNRIGFLDVQAMTVNTLTGVLYGIDNDTDVLVNFDTTNNLASQIGNHIGFDNIQCMAFDSLSDTMYAIDNDTMQLLTIELTGENAGVGTAVAEINAAFGGITGLAFNTANGLLYASTTTFEDPEGVEDDVTGKLLTIDPATGDITLIGGLGHPHIEAMTFDERNAGTLIGLNDAPADNNNGELDAVVVINIKTANTILIDNISDSAFKGIAIDSITGQVFGTDNNINKVIEFTVTFNSGERVNRINGNRWRGSLGSLGYYFINAMALNLSTGQLYAVDNNVNALLIVNRTSGVASRMFANTEVGFNSISAMTHDATNNIIYAIDVDDPDSARLITIDLDTGAGRFVGYLGIRVDHALAYDPNLDILYGIDNVTRMLITIDPETAAITVIGSQGLGFDDIQSLAFDHILNRMFAVDVATDKLLDIDMDTGEGEILGPISFGAVSAMAYDPYLRYLYAIDETYDDLMIIRVRMAASSSGGYVHVSCLAWDYEGSGRSGGEKVLWAIDDDLDQLVMIDSNTGTGESVGSVAEVIWVPVWPWGWNDYIGVTADNIEGLAFGGGVLYGIDSNSNYLFSFDRSGGGDHKLLSSVWYNWRNIRGIGFEDVRAMTYGRNTQTLYGFDRRTGQLIRISAGGSSATAIGSGTGYNDVQGLAFDPEENTIYGVDVFSDELVVINTGDDNPIEGVLVGVATSIGFTNHRKLIALAWRENN